MRAQNELYVGPSGSGKSAALSRYILEQAHENPDKSYYLIVPDQSASAYEKRLLGMNRDLFNIAGLLNVDILGMSRLAFRVFEEYDVPSGRVLEEFERSMMVRAACSHIKGKLNVYGSSIDKKGFIGQAKSLISEFLQYGISIEDIEMLIKRLEREGSVSLADKLHDIRLIYKEMKENFFQDIGTGLPEERMKVLVECLKNPGVKSFIDGAVVAFDEFRGFTPDQFDIISALENRTDKMIFTLTMDTDIVRKNIEVREHELFFQSYSTWKSLKELFVNAPVIKYYDRDTALSRFRINSGLSHLEKGIFRFPIKEYEVVPSDIELWKADDQVTELSVVAEDILQRVKSGARFRDFAIVTGDIAGLSAYADGVFKNYGIPVFIDESRSFGKNPFTEGLIKLLQIIDKDFNYDSVFGFIKLGLVDNDISGVLDVLENYCLRHGIRGRNIWEKKIEISSEALPNDLKDEITDDFQSAEKAREAVMALLSPMLDIDRRKSSVSEITEALKKMIAPDRLNYEDRINDTVEMYEKIGKPAEANAMSSLYDKILSMFESMEEIIGSEEISVHDYLEILTTGTEDMKLGVIPPTLDAVVVADCERSRIDRVKTIYFINMNDGILPSNTYESKILSDKDKDKILAVFQELGIRKILAPTDQVQSYIEQFFIYQILTRTEKRLVLSYADLNRDGSSMEPSYIIGRIKRLFPQLELKRRVPELFKGTKDTDIYGFTESIRTAMEMICDRDINKLEEEESFNDVIYNIAAFRNIDSEAFDYDERAVLYSNEAETIPQEIMKNLRIEISVSKLEKYASCPYSFFLRYILKLSPRQEKQLDYMDVGTILHRALELTGETVMQDYNNDWKAVDETVLDEVADRALKTALSENEFFKDEAGAEKSKTYVVSEELSSILHRTIDTVKYQISMGKMIPQAFEQKFSATFRASRPDGEEIPVTINGVIDRLDTYEADGEFLFRVVDYKTGEKTFDPRKVEAGTDLQLTVYTDVIREILKKEFGELSVIPAGMYYYHVANPDISAISESALKEAGGDENVAAAMEQRKLLRLRGTVNIDDPDYHKIAALQEIGIVDATGSIGKGTVIPIDKARTGNDYSKDTAVVGTEEMEKLGKYARNRMLGITEQILEGDISKHPVKYGKTGSSGCEYCDYGPICRFGTSGGKINYISDEGKNARETISDMIQNIQERVEYDRVERITEKSSGKSER